MSYNLLLNKKGIIFGALDEHSIAWSVTKRAYEEGAKIILSNSPVAIRMGKINDLAQLCETEVIPADISSVTDLENLLKNVMDKFGSGIDFILHSVGMSLNVRKNRIYTDTNYEYFLKTLDISALSFHKLLQTAQKLDAIREWGSVVTLSFIAAQRTFPGYNDMAEAKAMLESIVRSYGYNYGILKHVRINSVSQSPTKTTAGTGVHGFDVFYDYAQDLSPLGNASALSCADFCIALFSDLTRMVTMQNIYHDGGFSCTGISDELVKRYGK